MPIFNPRRHVDRQQRAEVIEDQHVGHGRMTSRHEGLVELIGGGVGQGHQPGDPVQIAAVTETAPIGQGQQTVAESMRRFLDEVIPTSEVRQLVAGPRGKSKDGRHHQQGGPPSL